MVDIIVMPEKLVFENKENDFKIYKVNIVNEKDEIVSSKETILGEMFELIIGLKYNVQAEKENNDIFGLQYRVNNIYKTDYSKQDEQLLFVELFGKRLLNKVIKETEYPITYFLKENIKHADFNISKNKLKDMKIKINANKIYIDLVYRFKEINIPFKLAKKIIDEYGYSAINKVKENPYILYKDINGIGFKRADQIAKNIGIKEDNEFRINAGINYILEENLNMSNTWIYIDYLQNELEKLLEIRIDNLDKFIYIDEFYLNGDKISLKKIVLMEQQIVNKLNKIDKSFCKRIFKNDVLENKIKSNSEFEYSEKQIEFIKSLNCNNLILLCGYAGTGKTASIRTFLKVYSNNFFNIQLCSPTAKAAKVLSKHTKRKAMTIHRLLGCSGEGFIFNKTNKLSCDLLIVDEASMVDMKMFNNLLSAIDDGCRVAVVGDIAQLESISCGNVFYDLIMSGKYKTIMYDEVYRQAKESGILSVANKVREGDNNYFKNLFKSQSNFIYDKDGIVGFINIKNNFNLFLNKKENMIDKILGIYKQSINKYGIDNVLVVTPYKKGDLGVCTLNNEIKKIINNKQGINIRNNIFSIDDRVKHTKNDYEREQFDKHGIMLNECGVFNGDFGTIVDIRDNIIYVDYENKIIKYEKPYNDLELAYAITCHSSQGSQADIVIGVLDISHYINLKRSLLYTMITRAEKNFILIANSNALFIAINNNSIIKKQTYIDDIINNKIKI